MTFIVAGFCLALYVLVTKKLTGKLAPKLWWLRPSLLFMFSASLAATWLGELLAGWLGGLFDWITDLFDVGAGGELIAGALLVLMVLGTVLDLKDKKPDGFAKTGLIMIPLLALIAAGPIASGTRDLTGKVSDGAENGVTSIIGSGG